MVTGICIVFLFVYRLSTHVCVCVGRGGKEVVRKYCVPLQITSSEATFSKKRAVPSNCISSLCEQLRMPSRYVAKWVFGNPGLRLAEKKPA